MIILLDKQIDVKYYTSVTSTQRHQLLQSTRM